MTGTFDNWSKSEKMTKAGDAFEKSVELPDTSEKIYYKVGAAVTLSIVSHHLQLSASALGMERACPRPRPRPRNEAAVCDAHQRQREARETADK